MQLVRSVDKQLLREKTASLIRKNDTNGLQSGYKTDTKRIHNTEYEYEYDNDIGR